MMFDDVMKWLGILCLLTGTVLAAPNQEKLAQITQDSVQMDLDAGTLYFNDQAVESKEVGDRLKSVYSIAFSGLSYSGTASMIDSKALVSFLEQIDAADISPERVNLNLYFPNRLKAEECDDLKLKVDGRVELNGEVMELVEFAADKLSGRPLSIWCGNPYGAADYRQLLAVCRKLGSDIQISSLFFVDRRMLKVAAEIYEIDGNGDKRVLSAPWQSSAPSRRYSVLGVVANESGIHPYNTDLDAFRQEDLAHLGIRFLMRRQIIGEDVRISGVAILRKGTAPKEERFRSEGIPYYSYSISKTVVPISLVFPPDVETIEFKVGEVDGTKTMCRVRVEIQDDQGSSIQR